MSKELKIYSPMGLLLFIAEPPMPFITRERKRYLDRDCDVADNVYHVFRKETD